MNSGWCVMKSVAGRNNSGWTPVRINFQEWRYNMGCMTCKNKNITQTMVDCSKYVCDVHFLLIWLLLIKDYTTNNLIKVWHWIDQIIFVYSLSKFLPKFSRGSNRTCTRSILPILSDQSCNGQSQIFVSISQINNFALGHISPQTCKNNNNDQ